MRVSLLSSTLGFGHIRAAQAIEEALRERDPQVGVEYVDFWSLMDRKVASAVREGYLEVVTREPELYDRLYAYDGDQWREFFRKPELPPALEHIAVALLDRWFPRRGHFPARGANLDQTLFLNLIGTFDRRSAAPHGNLIRRGLVIWMHTLLARRLKQRLQSFRPDTVVATQMMPAAVLAALKRRGDLDDVPAVGVLTDYGVHDLWLRSNMDHYCVATDSIAAELRARGIREDSIAVTGIPLMSGFRQPMPQVEARRQLGMDAHRPAVLITGGGYGIGAAEALAAILASDLDCQVLVAAAGQDANRRPLEALASRYSGRARLFLDKVEMPLLVRAADVVVGKPGGLSVSEALACGRPFLATSSLGGQESFNVTYLQRHRVGDLIGSEELVPRLRRWLADPLELARSQARAWSLGCRHGASSIANAVLGGRGIARADWHKGNQP